MPSSVGLNYGDLVLISDTLNPVQPGFISSPTSQWTYTQGPANAQVFQILSNNSSSPIPVDPVTKLPLPVNYGQTVVFATPSSQPSLISYGSTKLPVLSLDPQNSMLSNPLVGWTLTPYTQQSIGQMQAYSITDLKPTGPPIPPANQVYLTSAYKNTAAMSDLALTWRTEAIGKGAGIIQLWLNPALCNYNADCGNTPNLICYGAGPNVYGKCTNISQTPPAQFPAATAQLMLGTTCQATQGNNLIGNACIQYCTQQNSSVTKGSNTLTQCDQQMTVWCNAQYPGNGPDSVPGPDPTTGQPNWCTCLKAQGQQTPGPNTAPQCFYPGCAGCPSGTYCTASMLQQYNPVACNGQCSVVINCAQAGTCIVDNVNLCANCPSSSAPAGSTFNCGGDTKWYQKYWKELAGGVGGLFAVLLILVIILSHKKATTK